MTLQEAIVIIIHKEVLDKDPEGETEKLAWKLAQRKVELNYKRIIRGLEDNLEEPGEELEEE